MAKIAHPCASSWPLTVRRWKLWISRGRSFRFGFGLQPHEAQGPPEFVVQGSRHPKSTIAHGIQPEGWSWRHQRSHDSSPCLRDVGCCCTKKAILEAMTPIAEKFIAETNAQGEDSPRMAFLDRDRETTFADSRFFGILAGWRSSKTPR